MRGKAGRVAGGRAGRLAALLAMLLPAGTSTLDAADAWHLDGWSARAILTIAKPLADLPSSFESLASTQSNIGRMQAAGVTVAIGTINNDESHQARWVKQYAGNLVGLSRVPGATGLDWGHAFAAISSGPAEALGMGDRFGSLQPGRHGDVVIWDGDPLEIGSTAVAVYIDGVAQPLETRQQLLRDRYLTPPDGQLPNAYRR